MTSFAADAATQSNQNTVADIVFRNGNIHTIDSFHSRVQAVAIKDGKFLKVGSNDDIKAVTGKGTEVINLRGKMVMPGLIDTHIHAVRGALGQLYFCQFPVESSVEQIQAAVKKCAAGKKKGEWIEGKTWDSALSGKVTAADLDKAAPDNPVYLHDDTNHLGWLNTAALKAAKITKETPDPAGGAIDRDSSGNLDRIQIVKGFINKWGRTDEKIYDVALSDDRKADPKTGKIPPVGNTVDIKKATCTNDIGDSQLSAMWTDPDFDPGQKAVYYVRVLEIPTPRWSTYDSVRSGLPIPDGIPATRQERAWSSPIWYTPEATKTVQK